LGGAVASSIECGRELEEYQGGREGRGAAVEVVAGSPLIEILRTAPGYAAIISAQDGFVGKAWPAESSKREVGKGQIRR